MAKKYDIEKEIDEKEIDVTTEKNIKDMENFIDSLNKVKELDEQNPLEQAIKYRAVKQNPPEPGYMEVRCYEDKDDKGEPVVISESDIPKDDGSPSTEVKRFKHDPFFTTDLSKLIMADITACPSSVGPMLIDMAQKLVEIKKGAFKIDKRKSEFNWWWIVLAVLLIPGILTVVFMMFGGG
jgi:hypothetical protein